MRNLMRPGQMASLQQVRLSNLLYQPVIGDPVISNGYIQAYGVSGAHYIVPCFADLPDDIN